MIVSQLVIFAGLLLLVHQVNRDFLHPASVLLCAWIFTLVFHLASLVSLEYPMVSLELTLIHVGYVAIFVMGSCLQLKRRQSPLASDEDSGLAAGTSRPRSGDFKGFVGLGLAVLAVTMSAIVVFEIARKGVSVLDIETTRRDLWDGAREYTHSPLSLAKAMLRPFAIVFIISYPALPTRSLKAASLTAFFAIGVGEMLLSGGRFTLAFIVFGLFFSIAIHRRSLRKSIQGESALTPGRAAIAIVAIVSFLYLALGIFPSWRNSNLLGNEDHYLTLVAGPSEVSPWAKAVAKTTGLDSLRVFAYSSEYVTGPMMRSNYLLHETKATRWYFLGGNNFPLLSKVFALAIGGISQEDHVKNTIEKEQPYGRNPWFGGVMDVIIDFGILGGVLFMFIYGVLAGWVYRACDRTGAPELIVIYACLAICLVAFPQVSLLRLSLVSNTVLIAITLYVVTRRRNHFV